MSGAFDRNTNHGMGVDTIVYMYSIEQQLPAKNGAIAWAGISEEVYTQVTYLYAALPISRSLNHEEPRPRPCSGVRFFEPLCARRDVIFTSIERHGRRLFLIILPEVTPGHDVHTETMRSHAHSAIRRNHGGCMSRVAISRVGSSLMGRANAAWCISPRGPSRATCVSFGGSAAGEVILP